MNNRIPKNIHFMWFQGFEDITFPKQGNEYINMWKEKNPNWKIVLWDEQKATDFILKNYPSYYGCWKNLDKVVKKCDFVRWLILHFYGGAYCDIDIVPKKSLDDFLSEDKIYYHNLKNTICYPPWENKKFFPKENDVIKFDSNKFNLFLLNEWFKPDGINEYVITNCFLLGIKGFNLYLDYLNSCVHYKDSSVLESFGTWRLTRYICSIPKEEKEKVFLIPAAYGHYTGWTSWTHSTDIQFIDHKFLTNWADKTKEKGWLI